MALTDLQKIGNGRITAQFDGEALAFRSPTLSDLVDFEDQFGDVKDALGAKSKHGQIKPLRFLLYLALRHDRPDITEKQAGDFFAMSDLEDGGVAVQIIEALLPESAASPKVRATPAK